MKKAWFIGGLVGTSLVNQACAQDALRMSAAGEEAAEAQAQADQTLGYYNLRLGDLRLRLASEVAVEGDDNVNLVSTNRVADVLFQPSINTQLTYPVSQKNSLKVNLAVGYTAYVRQQFLDQFFFAPGTELAFKMYIKDFVIELHDWFSMTEESYDNPAAANEANYSYLQNAAGLTATWDLDKVRITGAYDHDILDALNAADQQENSSQDLFSLRAGTDLNRFSELGLEASAGLIQYEQATLQGGNQYSVGLYYHLRLSQNFSLRADAGYVFYNLNTPAVASTNYQQSVNAFYGSLTLEHQVNQHLRYSLKIGRGLDAGLFSDTLEMYYAKLETDLNLIRKWDLKLFFSYDNGSETGGLGENFDVYGCGATISHFLTRNLLLSLNYSFWDRFSNLPDRTYTDDQVLLTLTYKF